MNIIFLGGIYTPSIQEVIQKKSIGPIQNAADALQKNYLRGFSEIDEIEEIRVINLPYIGSYPSLFKDKYFTPEIKEEFLYSRVAVFNYGFNNIKAIKSIARFWRSFKEIRKITHDNKDYHIVCYSMHLPFLLSCFLNKLRSDKCKYYIIVPDLPEFMSVRHGLNKKLYTLLSKLSYYIVNRSNGISVITKEMSERFDTSVGTTIIEGIVSEPPKLENRVCPSPNQSELGDYFLYTGTLDSRYGIRDLINAYNQSKISNNTKLVICGDGDDREYVEIEQRKNPQIVYLGQITREDAQLLQKKAKLLINPRNNEGEFTKFSFPSKIIEYMSSGTPVLMYKLDGIPDSYDRYYFEITSQADFPLILKNISEKDPEELVSMGKIAREFIFENTTPKQQVLKFYSLMKK
ncbi:glycosyltransferase [Serratia aquatilis]|uniref:Glycosyltransferase n=1 Tax=Serratia aquatilis TaxID=1737515 RepID=A0ABV6EJU0_9GAMM